MDDHAPRHRRTPSAGQAAPAWRGTPVRAAAAGAAPGASPSHPLLRWLWRHAPAPGGSPKRRFLLAAMAAAYALFTATYLPINLYSIGRDAHVLFLPGEARIPFVPEFEYLYLWGYVLPLIAIWKPPSVRRFVQLLCAFLVTLSVAYTTYLLYPVYLERPVLTVDSPATFLLSIEYLDPSYNHFPSLHVAITWLVYFACRDGVRRPGLFAALAGGISVSTVFIKQHYIVDVLYGFALARLAWALAGRASLLDAISSADRAHEMKPEQPAQYGRAPAGGKGGRRAGAVFFASPGSSGRVAKPGPGRE